MGVVENVVDAAAEFVGPFVDANRKQSPAGGDDFELGALIQHAVSHLQAIHDADLDADPDAPYDASLAGVVYGLLDLIITFGVLPYLSPGVEFSQRPRSVLTAACPISKGKHESQLLKVANALVPLLEQKGRGVQPLLSQRNLPDVIAALAELAFSPMHEDQNRTFVPIYEKVIEETPTSRLLPILTTFLQQQLPTWLQPLMSRQLAVMPLRQRGVRHTVEFLSLSYLSKTSQVPQDASVSQSQIPIPLEAVTQASRLLVLPPAGMNQDEWLHKLAPQLWTLLDGDEGVELSRAAGQIIAGGVLSKRATGAPNSFGWQLFAQPLLQTICPKDIKAGLHSESDVSVLVPEIDLELALKRLSAIASSYSHAGLLKRLLTPVLLSAWALLSYAHERPALNRKWVVLAKSILIRYMSIVCEPNQVYQIAANLFWSGDAAWSFKPGSQGGVEIRRRSEGDQNSNDMNNILTRIGNLGSRIGLLVSLLDDAKAPDEAIGAIFLQATQRWLSPMQDTKTYLTDEADTDDPFAVLTDAKLSEAMGITFKAQLARNPQHIIELMGQLLSNFTREHKTKVQKLAERDKLSRASLRNLVKTEHDGQGNTESRNDADEELVSLAISILSTLVSSSQFKQTPATQTILASVVASLDYISQDHTPIPISLLIINSAKNLLQVLQPPPISTQTRDTEAATSARATLKTILTDLTSPEPPNRTWALDALRKFMQDPATFSVMDVPSMTHLLLSASLSDPESYVHTAAMPVLLDLALLAPNPAVGIYVDAFVDVDEASLKLSQGKQNDEKRLELQHALDFRLRVGEVLNTFVLSDTFFHARKDSGTKHKCLQRISNACLSLSSRRGTRTQTLSTRTSLAQAEQERQNEAETAWGGPIPNLLDPEGESGVEDQAERDALLKIVQGWEDTGVEEDVRIRASALSVLATVMEHRLGFLRQVTVDAALQMVLLIVSMERSDAQALVRRAATMVVMGLLRGLDGVLGDGKDGDVGLNITQQNEVERVLRWVGSEDTDALVRDHAGSVLEGLETWRMKKLYQFKEQGLALSADLGLEGNLRGLQMQPSTITTDNGRRKMVVEELD
jgi:hypothetical protein